MLRSKSLLPASSREGGTPSTADQCLVHLCSATHRRSTFEALLRWLSDVRAQASDNLIVVVVGNKTDLVELPAGHAASFDDGEDGDDGDSPHLRPRREVSYQEAKEWAESQGLALVETSSLTGQNIESPFTMCARSVLELIERGIVVPGQREYRLLREVCVASSRL